MKFRTYHYAILLVIFILGQSISTTAQDRKWKFGLFGSVNIDWVSPGSKNIENFGTPLGFSYGLLADYNFADNYAFATGLSITDLNTKISYVKPLIENPSYDANENNLQDTFGSVNLSLKNRYIQIPVSIKFKTKEIGYIKYWAQFGVNPSFLIRTRGTYEGVNPQSEYEDYNVNEKDYSNQHFLNEEDGSEYNDRVFFFRVPLIIGAGIEYSLAGSTSLYAGIRLDNGFTDMFVADKNVKANNNYCGLNLGILF